VGTVRVPFACAAVSRPFRSLHAVSPRGAAGSERVPLTPSYRESPALRVGPLPWVSAFHSGAYLRAADRLHLQVKLHLEEAYKKDLTEHKDLIKELITSIVAHMEPDPRE
jgi:hypothetical protein